MSEPTVRGSEPPAASFLVCLIMAARSGHRSLHAATCPLFKFDFGRTAPSPPPLINRPPPAAAASALTPSWCALWMTYAGRPLCGPYLHGLFHGK